MSKLTGSKHMKANGKTQVSIYLFENEIKQLDRIAKRGRCRRAAIVANIVRNQLAAMREVHR